MNRMEYNQKWKQTTAANECTLTIVAIGFQAACHHHVASNLKNTQYVTTGCIRFSSVFSKSILGSFSYFDVGYNKGLKLLKVNPSIYTWKWIFFCVELHYGTVLRVGFYETKTKIGLNSTPAPLKSPIVQFDTQGASPTSNPITAESLRNSEFDVTMHIFAHVWESWQSWLMHGGSQLP